MLMLPKKSLRIAQKNSIPLIYLSTECVFEGKKEFYAEYDKKQPINWYGYTKSAAEDNILSFCNNAAIIRSVVAYHKNDNGKTLYGKILKSLSLSRVTYAVGDHLFTPTYTKDIIKSIEIVIRKQLKGVYHVVPKTRLSPFDFASLIATKNGYPRSSLIKVNLIDYYGAERASLRLQNSCLASSNSIKILKFIPLSPKQVILT